MTIIGRFNHSDQFIDSVKRQDSFERIINITTVQCESQLSIKNSDLCLHFMHSICCLLNYIVDEITFKSNIVDIINEALITQNVMIVRCGKDEYNFSSLDSSNKNSYSTLITTHLHRTQKMNRKDYNYIESLAKSHLNNSSYNQSNDQFNSNNFDCFTFICLNKKLRGDHTVISARWLICSSLTRSAAALSELINQSNGLNTKSKSNITNDIAQCLIDRGFYNWRSHFDSSTNKFFFTSFGIRLTKNGVKRFLEVTMYVCRLYEALLTSIQLTQISKPGRNCGMSIFFYESLKHKFQYKECGKYKCELRLSDVLTSNDYNDYIIIIRFLDFKLDTNENITQNS